MHRCIHIVVDEVVQVFARSVVIDNHAGSSTMRRTGSESNVHASGASPELKPSRIGGEIELIAGARVLLGRGDWRATCSAPAMLCRLQRAGVFSRFPKRDKLTEQSARNSVVFESTLTAQGNWEKSRPRPPQIPAFVADDIGSTQASIQSSKQAKSVFATSRRTALKSSLRRSQIAVRKAISRTFPCESCLPPTGAAPIAAKAVPVAGHVRRLPGGARY